MNELQKVADMLDRQIRINAIAATCRFDFAQLMDVKQLAEDVFLFKNDYYHVRHYHERLNHYDDKYRSCFTVCWQYMGVDGYTTVYRLRKFDYET